jgi:hypothetical protein
MKGLPILHSFILTDSCIDIIDECSCSLNIPREKAVELLIAEGWKYTNKQPFDRGVNSPDLSEIEKRLERMEHMIESIVYAVDAIPF